MQKKYLSFITLAAAAVLVLPFLPNPGGAAARWSVFPGRFHILLVHFPVVLVLGLIGLEGWRLVQPSAAWGRLLPVLWGITLASCFATVLAGYFLYLTGEYQGSLVRQHFWGGVLLMIVLCGAAFVRFVQQHNLLFGAMLGLAGGLVFYTAHLGGSLTHGPDFLTEHLPRLGKEKPAPIENKKPEELLVYQDLIAPIFENRCLSCHNEYKTKGGLLMTSLASLNKGGKSGQPMLVDGQPERSELHRRITLPPGDDDHMPPPEKAPLTEDEITLINWWISEGASAEQLLGDGPPGPEGRALIDRYLPQLFQAERLKVQQQEETEALAEELAKLGKKLELIIEPDPSSEAGGFAVSLPVPPPVIDDQIIAKLLPYAEVFSKVSLPGAGITDDGLYDLSRMKNLEKLYLPKTCIKGEGLAYLQSLSGLKELNLSYSWLTNEGALHLLNLDQLEKAYVFGTEADDNVLNAVQEHLSNTQILREEGPYF